MNIKDLGEYLSRNNVPLEMRIGTLIQSGLSNDQFIILSEGLLESASEAEKSRCAKKVQQLNHFVEMRKLRA